MPDTLQLYSPKDKSMEKPDMCAFRVGASGDIKKYVPAVFKLPAENLENVVVAMDVEALKAFGIGKLLSHASGSDTVVKKYCSPCKFKNCCDLPYYFL